MTDDVTETKKALLRDLLATADKRQGQPLVMQISEDNFHEIDYPEFWKDLIIGAKELSTFLFGTPDKVRSAFYLGEKTTLPICRLGSKLLAQKSVIRAFFWARQRRAFRDEQEEQLVRLGVLLQKLLVLVRAAQQEGVAKPGDIHLWMALLTETSRSIDLVLKSR
jgi:hypothetical protein